MAGNIEKRGPGVYKVRVFLGRDAHSGKVLRQSKTIHGTKKDAERCLTAMLREKDLGRFAEPGRCSLNEFLDEWLETVASRKLRPKTLADYTSLLARYVRPKLGGLRLDRLTPILIQNLYVELQRPKKVVKRVPAPEGQRGTRQVEELKSLSARTIRYTHAVLTSALKHAVRICRLQQNPAEFCELPKQQRKEMLALGPESAARFLEASRQDQWEALFYLALSTGARPGEYLALQWPDLNLDNRTMTIQRTIARKKAVRDKKGRQLEEATWYLQPPKTSKSRRTIILTATAVELLRRHHARQAQERLAAGAAYAQHGFVFANPIGEPLEARNIAKRHFKGILKRAGLDERIRLYDLRHSAATLLLSANQHAKVVAEQLGHSTITLTLDTYSHVLPTMRSRTACASRSAANSAARDERSMPFS